MKTAIKILILVLTLIMCISCFAACKEEEGEKTAPSDTAPASDTTDDTTAHVHEFGEWAHIKIPTCTDEGVDVRVCFCREIETREISAVGHSETEISGKDATCTEAGLTDGKKCSVCGTVTLNQTEIAAKGHSYANGICTVCNEIKTSEGLRYTINADGQSYSVTGIGMCSDANIVIPSAYNGKPVTSIGASAFKDCKSITGVTIPDGVTSIGNDAFFSCSLLTSITIPDGVTSIGDYAFYGCTALTSITIPGSVTSIGRSAFSGCTSLTSITIPDSVTSIGDYAFYGCTSLTSITIPDGVTSIGYEAFYGCTSLTSVTIGNGVTSIGDRAFYGCTSLTSVTIGNGVTSIGDWAFNGCTSLTSVTIGNGVTSIGDWAFRSCKSLTSITYDGRKAQWNAISKASTWNYNTGNYTVHCTDGDI